MTILGDFYRLTLNWDLPGGEKASITSHWLPAGGGGGTFVDDAARLSGRADAFWTALKGSYASSTAYTGTRVDLLDLTGHVVQSLESAVTPVPGTQSANALPTECAIVVSTKTPFSGRRARGRFYLPAPTVLNVSAVGRLATGTVTAFADAAQTFLGSFTGPEIDPVLYSRADPSLTALASIKVGDVIDVQRRRRFDLVEVYQSRTLS